MKASFTFLLIAISVWTSQAQNCNKQALKGSISAEELILIGDLKAAEKILDQVKSKSKKCPTYFNTVAVLALQHHQYEKAIEMYEKSFQLDENQSFVVRRLARISFLSGKYEKAKHYFELSQNLKSGLKNSKDFEQKIDLAIQYSSQNHEPRQALSDSINSIYNEYLPSITVDGSRVIFTRAYPNALGVMSEDFFVSEKIDNEKFRKAKLLGKPFNTSENEGAICTTADGKSIYFTACSRSDGYGSCDIYESHLKSGHWTIPRNLGESVNSGYWESQPAISPDGKRLFFVSNRPGGFGKRDIWFVEKRSDGTWSSPYNCGENINSKQDEMSPFLHWDNRHFYFATTGRLGLGGYDLYLSENQIEKGRFSKPKHLPFPFNSPFDDNSLVIEHDGKTAYFISEQVRDSSLNHDLFSCQLPQEFQSEEVRFLSADIVDNQNKIALEKADVLIKNLATNETVFEGESAYGHFYACLDPSQDYAVFISKPNYMYYSTHVPKPENPQELWYAKFELQALEVGEQMQLNALFFAFNSDELLPSSQPELEVLIDLLETNPNLQIKLIGHTDDLGEADYNLNLSTKRAEAIKKALLNFGMNSERILTEGKGESEPIVENNSDEHRAKNRRTELKIMAL